MKSLLNYPFDLAVLPEWLAGIMPQLWRVGVIIVAVFAAWALSFAVKLAVRIVGQFLAKRAGKPFEGSLWDMLAPIAQLGTFAASITIALQLLGLSLGAKLANAWPATIWILVVFSAAFFVAKWVRTAINGFGERAQQSTHADRTLFEFFGTVAGYAVFVVAGVMALNRAGFDTTTLVALVGAAGLAIGLALQDTLKNAASGVMLAVFRPYRLGDWTRIGEHEGEVISISPFQTQLRAIDNRVEIVPNTIAWSQTVTNYSKLPRRRVDLLIDVSYDDDIDHVLGVMTEVAKAHPRVLAKDDVWAGVHAFATSSMVIRLRAFVPGPEFIQVRADIYRAIKYAFDREGITIPYPHQVEVFRTKEDLSRKRGDDADHMTHHDEGD